MRIAVESDECSLHVHLSGAGRRGWSPFATAQRNKQTGEIIVRCGGCDKRNCRGFTTGAEARRAVARQLGPTSVKARPPASQTGKHTMTGENARYDNREHTEALAVGRNPQGRGMPQMRMRPSAGAQYAALDGPDRPVPPVPALWPAGDDLRGHAVEGRRRNRVKPEKPGANDRYGTICCRQPEVPSWGAASAVV